MQGRTNNEVSLLSIRLQLETTDPNLRNPLRVVLDVDQSGLGNPNITLRRLPISRYQAEKRPTLKSTIINVSIKPSGHRLLALNRPESVIVAAVDPASPGDLTGSARLASARNGLMHRLAERSITGYTRIEDDGGGFGQRPNQPEAYGGIGPEALLEGSLRTPQLKPGVCRESRPGFDLRRQRLRQKTT